MDFSHVAFALSLTRSGFAEHKKTYADIVASVSTKHIWGGVVCSGWLRSGLTEDDKGGGEANSLHDN